MAEPLRYRIPLSSLVLLVASACAVAPAPVSRAEPLSESEVAEVIGIMAMEDARADSIAPLLRLSGSTSAPLRSRAALALGRLRHPEGRPALLGLLHDPDTTVAATAAFALGQLGDSTAAADLARLLDAAPTARAGVAAEAAHALGKLRGVEADSALRAFLLSAPADPPRREVVASALLATWRHPRPGDLTPILRWTSSADPEIRWRAAYALVRRPTPGAGATLGSLLSDPDPRVRAMAVRGLPSTLADSAGIRSTVLPALLRAVDDPDYAVRVNAARALGTYAESADVVATLIRLLEGSDPHLGFTAAESLMRLGTGAAAAVPALEAISLAPERPLAVRQAAVEALAPIDPAAAGRAAERLTHRPEWRLRASAARVFAAPGVAAWERAERLVRDPDPRVGSAALQAITARGEEGPLRFRSLVVESLSSPDVGIRTAALNALGRSPEPWTLPLLLDAYARAERDDKKDATLAAVDAIARLAEADSAAGRAFFARFPRSSDYLVRLRVRERFGAAAERWGEPLPLNPPPTRYDEILAFAHSSHPGPRVRLETEAGTIDLRLYADEAPLTVANFLSLAGAGYFDGQEWPRVVPNFVVQGGDPRGDTSGGPGYSIRDEINRRRYGTGTLGMALSGPDTGGSQWFITHSPQPHLDGIYTVFGEVVSGQQVTERILPGDRIHRIYLLP